MFRHDEPSRQDGTHGLLNNRRLLSIARIYVIYQYIKFERIICKAHAHKEANDLKERTAILANQILHFKQWK